MTIRTRALIVYQGKLLTVRLAEMDWCCLPGGKLDKFELLDNGMQREIEEEFGIKPVLGEIACIQEFIYEGKHNIEFFYWIENGGDFLNVDLSKASHGHEIAEIKWLNIEQSDANVELYPKAILPWLQDKDNLKKLGRIVNVGR